MRKRIFNQEIVGQKLEMKLEFETLKYNQRQWNLSGESIEEKLDGGNAE